jgi:4-hydroxy-tetrahydrodipicolinate synthase
MTGQIISAVPTPFRPSGDLDMPAFEDVLRSLEGHVDGVLVAGTTGEFPALEDEERVELFRCAADVLGAQRVIAHLGHASSRQVLGLAEAAMPLGITRFALLTPYYLPTDDDGVVAFFRELTGAALGMRVYAYLFPDRTGIDVPVEVLGRIMQLPGMAGVKLSGGAATRLPEYAPTLRDGQELYSGNDATLPWVLAQGGTGVVSGVSAAFPQTFASLGRALGNGHRSAGEELQATAERLVALTGSTVARLKAALAARSGAPWASRMSQPRVDTVLRAAIEEAVAQHG